MVKLRVSVGGSYTDLAIVNCNDEFHPIEFDGPEFKGRAVVRIKDFVGITNDGSEPLTNSDYFKGRNRRFSFQVEGRYKREWDGQEVYFGTDFDRSVDLPDGFEMMLKIARYIDPVVRTSLTKDGQPWILSPLVSSINTMAAWKPTDAEPASRKLPSPPATPRASVDISRAFSMMESGVSAGAGAVSSAWGFLGKLKKGSRSSVAISASANTSTDHLDTRINKRMSMPPNAFSGTPPITPSTSPQPGTFSPAASSSTSDDWSKMSKTTPSSSSSNSSLTVDVNDKALGPWRQIVEEDTTFFLPNKPSLTTPQRRKHFQTEENRKEFKYQTDLVYGYEFFSPHMDFNTFDIRMGLSMNVRKYLAGQPVRYVCRTLDGKTVFWAVQFELVD
ncbi:hypothetical protein BG004_007455 [Podila humilis]|nr:hypothetical protein BG004_007455 [Podila humilis]